MINRSMFHTWLDSGFLTVSGADRVPFVHGLVTADVRSLTPGSGTGALLLNHRGHALVQLTVVNLGDRLLLAIEGGQTDFVRAELDRHIIFDQVTLADETGTWQQLTVQGPEAARVADAVAAGVELAGRAAVRRSAAGGLDLFFTGDRERASALAAAAGSAELTPAGLDAARVAGLAPQAATEAGEGVLPQEAGLEPLVSYRKGCYLGQEIMARIEARGNLRRGLRRLHLTGDPAGERDIKLDDRSVGRLGTVVPAENGSGSSALAVIRLDLPADAVLTVGSARATVDG